MDTQYQKYAVADAATRAKLGKPAAWQVRYLERPATPFERFFSHLAETRMGAAWLRDSGLTQALLAHALPRTQGDLRFLDAAMHPRPGAPVTALAHCFCGL